MAQMMPFVEANKTALGEVLLNHALDLDGPKVLGRAKHMTSKEAYAARLSRGWFEVQHSEKALSDTQVYLRRFPFERTSVRRESYLQFHIEAYFHELYVFELRTERFLKMIDRQFRRDPEVPKSKEICEALMALVKTTMKVRTEVRGAHVHGEYRLSDEGIDRLSSLGLLSLRGRSKLTLLLRKAYEREYVLVRRRLLAYVRQANQDLMALLDAVCEELGKIVFNEDGTLRVPRGIR